jgi:hypothetical protein
MGMFDYLTYNNKLYQTKDLECTLNRYELKDGILYLNEEKVIYTGGLYFYNYIDNKWEEYFAEFYEGFILNLQLLETR